jgi:putative ABC transport system substrate-binding protein
VFVFRWADNVYERLPGLAADLVNSKVDVIVTHATPGTRAAINATKTIPIVIASSGEAVALGLVASLAHPGGNVTGSTIFVSEYMVKWLELLKQAMPSMKRAGTLFNPANPVSDLALAAMEVSARNLQIRFQTFAARRPEDIEQSFEAMAKARVETVAVFPDAVLVANAGVIARLATKYRIGVAGTTEFAEQGALIGYSEVNREMYRRAAYFVDKILKGAKPADLPVERPSKFELVLNLKTAKALGIKMPQSVLLRADRVIE